MVTASPSSSSDSSGPAGDRVLLIDDRLDMLVTSEPLSEIDDTLGRLVDNSPLPAPATTRTRRRGRGDGSSAEEERAAAAAL